MQELKNIVLIGAGNVATHLGLALNKAGIKVLQVYSRTPESAERLASQLQTSFTINLDLLIEDAHLYIIAVADHALDDVVKGMKARNKFVVHTSGFADMNLLEPHAQNHGVLYPLQTFSRTRNIDFSSVPVCIEANSLQNIELLNLLASRISGDIRTIPSSRRRILHLAAVFACNFPNFMYGVAESILQKANLDFDLLKPLILETATKVQSVRPGKAQTGPAVRGDSKVMKEHLEMLKTDPEFMELYGMISEAIATLYKR